MLAMADRKGRVWASVPGLANRARVAVEDTRAALITLLAPDPDSRTTDHDGRRIEPMDGGWMLLNYLKYREMRDEDTRAEQNRAAQATFRSKQNKQEVSTVSHGKPESAQAEAEAEEERESRGHRNRGSRLTLDVLPPDWETFCRTTRPDLDPAKSFASFRDYWIAKPGKDGVKLDWSATWRNWVRRERPGTQSDSTRLAL